MQNPEFWIAFAGVFVGPAVTWMIFRGRLQAQAEAAIASARQASDAEEIKDREAFRQILLDDIRSLRDRLNECEARCRECQEHHLQSKQDLLDMTARVRDLEARLERRTRPSRRNGSPAQQQGK